MESKEFGEFIRKVRKEKKLTLKELAEAANVSQSYITNVENNKRGIPSPDILKKLAKPLGLSPLRIMFEAGYVTMDDVNKNFNESLYVSNMLKGIENIKERLMMNTSLIEPARKVLTNELAIQGLNEITPDNFFDKVEVLKDLLVDRMKNLESSKEIREANKQLIKVLNLIMDIAYYRDQLNEDLSLTTDHGDSLSGSAAVEYLRNKEREAQDDTILIFPATDTDKETTELMEKLKKSAEEKALADPYGVKKEFDDKLRNMMTYDVHYLLAYRKRAYYKGHEINENQRKLILAYLDALFPGESGNYLLSGSKQDAPKS